MEIWMENQAISKYLQTHRRIGNPTFDDINRSIAQQLSSIMSARRFGGQGGFKTFSELQSHSVCYPPVKFLTTANPAKELGQGVDNRSLSELTSDCFKSAFNFMQLNESHDYWFGPTNIVYHQVNQTDANQAAIEVQGQKREAKVLSENRQGVITASVAKRSPLDPDQEQTQQSKCQISSFLAFNINVMESTSRWSHKFDLLHA